jgi:hypothetical protein
MTARTVFARHARASQRAGIRFAYQNMLWASSEAVLETEWIALMRAERSYRSSALGRRPTVTIGSGRGHWRRQRPA